MVQHIQLKDICKVLNGCAFKSSKYVDKGIRIIRITNVQKGYIDDEAPQYYPVESEKEIGKYMLREGDLLMSLTGNVGRVAILKKEMLPAALNQRVACLRLKESANVYKPYLFHLLNSDFFENQCVFSAQGIAQKNMSTEWLKKYRIPLYSIEKQKNIADLFDQIDALIDGRKKQKCKLDILVKSRFIEMFGDPKINPKKWDITTIGDIATDVRYGTSKPSNEDGKYPYLRMNNLTYEGYLDLTDLKHIDIPDNEIEKCVVRNGDILFNRTNSIELVGKTCVYNLDCDMIIAGYIIRVRIDNRMLPVVISSYLNSTVMKKQLRSMAKGAVNQANINAQELKSIPIYLPPISIQNKFAAFVEQVDKSKFEIQKSIEKLEILKKSLMQKYFG